MSRRNDFREPGQLHSGGSPTFEGAAAGRDAERAVIVDARHKIIARLT